MSSSLVEARVEALVYGRTVTALRPSPTPTFCDLPRAIQSKDFELAETHQTQR